MTTVPGADDRLVSYLKALVIGSRYLAPSFVNSETIVEEAALAYFNYTCIPGIHMQGGRNIQNLPSDNSAT
jgi:hypothetical protein